MHAAFMWQAECCANVGSASIYNLGQRPARLSLLQACPVAHEETPSYIIKRLQSQSRQTLLALVSRRVLCPRPAVDMLTACVQLRTRLSEVSQGHTLLRIASGTSGG